jgi:hypothetical protein
MWDMRLVQHEEGWIYNLFGIEQKNPAAPVSDRSPAIAQRLYRDIDKDSYDVNTAAIQRC